MSLELAAKHMAAQGRGPDTMLVHMAPKEVAGLQALAMAHGGSLSINPKTGLPEAGFLSSLLPTLIGAGLTFMSGGALSPLMAAGLVGGGYGLATGSLGKGLMAGLGAFGGASLGAGLTGVGTQSLGNAAAAATQAANPALTAGEIAREMGTAGFVDPGLAASVNPATASSLTKAGVGLEQSLSNPSLLANAMGGTNKALQAGAMAFGPALMAATQPKTAMPPEQKPNPYQYTFSRGPANPFPQPDMEGREQTYFDPGYTRNSPPPEETARRPATPMPTTPMPMPLGGYAEGGIAALAGGGQGHLGSYSDGGRLLKGPGDGVSDSIPANIAGKQPARLADGEFVVPARIVSEIGNGSTEAGARKLYAMMDRVQAARRKTVGKDKVAVNSRADKLLPA